MNTLKEKMNRYMDAGFPILYLNTFEEEKADELIKSIIGGRTVMEWSMDGFVDPSQNLQRDEERLADTLATLLLKDERKFLERKVLVLKDAHFFLENHPDTPAVVSRLKKLAQLINEGLDGFNIVIVSPVTKIPKELENYLTLLTMDYLTQEDIREVIQDFCAEQEIDPLEEKFLNELSLAFKGLSEFEIRNILALALSDGGKITRADLSLVIEQKRQLIQKAGILEMIPLQESLEDIGGLESLKDWLKRKEKIFKNIDEAEAYGVDIPKGVLIAGMPGCGKSLNAKAAAKLFGIPLLRLDMGRLMGKYVGESEANMRRAIALAEAISPCVLWIDELEKAFAGIGGEGGGADVTTRLFGTFLTWLQEKDSLAFVVATANDIAKMPPELLRKGRFDEIFYVALPKQQEREKIFSIHIKRRRPKDLVNIDIKQLAGKTEGYSGADIEGVVKDSVEEAFSKDEEHVTTDGILKAIKNTHSLSEIMKDSIKKMSELYESRKFKNASK